MQITAELKDLFRCEIEGKTNEHCSKLNNGAFFFSSKEATNCTIIRRIQFLTEAPLPAWVSLIRNITGERRNPDV